RRLLFRSRLAVSLLVLQYRCKNCQAIPSPLFFIHLNAVVDISIWEHLLICIHKWVNKLSEERPLTLCYILFCCLCVYYWKGQLAALCLSIDFYFYDYFGLSHIQLPCIPFTALLGLATAFLPLYLSLSIG